MKRVLGILAMVLFMAMVSGGGNAAETVQAYKLPSFIAINSHDVGASGFNAVSYMTEAITQRTGQKFRVLPGTTDVGRLAALRAGSAHFSAAGSGPLFASAGREEFANRSWGPQDLYVVWCAAFPGWAMAVRGDSGLKKPADLKGKKVAYIEGWPATNVQIAATLAFGGLTWKDVQVVKVSSHNAACEGVLAGTIDTFNTLPTSTFAFRLQSAAHGVGYIEHPFDDAEGWKRAAEVFPFIAKYTAVMGAGVSKEAPLHSFTNANPLIVAYGNQSPDLVYWLTKNIAEGYPTYAQKAELMKLNWTMEWNLELIKSTSAPVHSGTIRYLKEIGKWTPQLEALNQQRLENRKALFDLWKRALETSKKEKISDEDFPAYWEKMRAQAGPKYAW